MRHAKKFGFTDPNSMYALFNYTTNPFKSKFLLNNKAYKKMIANNHSRLKHNIIYINTQKVSIKKVMEKVPLSPKLQQVEKTA
jgi:hypothetical protein